MNEHSNKLFFEVNMKLTEMKLKRKTVKMIEKLENIISVNEDMQIVTLEHLKDGKMRNLIIFMYLI